MTKIIKRVALSLALLDVVAYFAVLRPVQNMWQASAERFDTVRLEGLKEEARVSRLKWYTDEVPDMQKDVDGFLDNEVQPKKKSFSRITRLVIGLADKTGVSLPPAAIGYQTDQQHGQLLDRMGLMVTAKGPFKNLLEFAHELETTSDDFLVFRNVRLDAGESGDLTLQLAADFYLTP
ncbi:MAG TPA: hypothetical protein VKV95_14490 [Terriglobia bacterium]|nr:hypothetical protein [Terriglobia bacterium]